MKNALRIKELLDTLTARTQILELQQDISAKIEEEDVTNEDFRTRLLVPILDRISSVFGADGVTLHVRRTGVVELSAAASTTWPGGVPPEFVATLGLEEDPRTGRAPRLPGETRDAATDWTITSAPVFGGRELFGTLRLYRRGPLSPPGESPELEHLIAFASHLGRTLHRLQLVDELRAKAGA